MTAASNNCGRQRSAILVTVNGETLPLHYYQRGMTRQAHIEAQQQLDEQRKRALSVDLRIRRKPCDQVLQVIKNSAGSFTAICDVAGQRVQYTEGISGLE